MVFSAATLPLMPAAAEKGEKSKKKSMKLWVIAEGRADNSIHVPATLTQGQPQRPQSAADRRLLAWPKVPRPKKNKHKLMSEEYRSTVWRDRKKKIEKPRARTNQDGTQVGRRHHSGRRMAAGPVDIGGHG